MGVLLWIGKKVEMKKTQWGALNQSDSAPVFVNAELAVQRRFVGDKQKCRRAAGTIAQGDGGIARRAAGVRLDHGEGGGFHLHSSLAFDLVKDLGR
jgi:hypothetical protein